MSQEGDGVGGEGGGLYFLLETDRAQPAGGGRDRLCGGDGGGGDQTTYPGKRGGRWSV